MKLWIDNGSLLNSLNNVGLFNNNSGACLSKFKKSLKASVDIISLRKQHSWRYSCNKFFLTVNSLNEVTLKRDFPDNVGGSEITWDNAFWRFSKSEYNFSIDHFLFVYKLIQFNLYNVSRFWFINFSEKEEMFACNVDFMKSSAI